MPPEAQAADVKGAATFVRYYFETVNYAYATGDTEPMDAIADPNCKGCVALKNSIRDAFQGGVRGEGAQIHVSDVVVTPGDPALGLEVDVAAAQDSGRIYDDSGAVIAEVAGSAQSLSEFIVIHEGGWKVREWGTHAAQN